MRTLVLGTRGSKLALWQARHVTERLRALHPGLSIEERIVRTEGDRSREPFDVSDERGLFVKEIEAALLAGEVDFAVHSLKDLPTVQPQGLVLAAIPARHDPRDALLTEDGRSLENLPREARVGTGSPRRRCQLLHARPDLDVVPVRGNVDTRLGKLRSGQFDALVLALAGIERLGLTEVPMRPIPVETCLPAVGQGALAIEARGDDAALLELLRPLGDPASTAAVTAERACLRRLEGGCLAPATAHAAAANGGMRLSAIVGDLSGRTMLRAADDGEGHDGEALGARVAERLLADGAGALLRAARAGGPAT